MSSSRTSTRRIPLPVLLAFPVVILLGWYTFQQIWLSSRSHSPRWSVTLAEQAFAMPCDTIVGAGLPDAEILPANTPTGISSFVAAMVADSALLHQPFISFDSKTASAAHPATKVRSQVRLVRATFPDGTVHVAWGRAIGIRNDNAFDVEAVLIYVDASSAEPLLSVDNILLGDAYMMCGPDVSTMLFGVLWIYAPLALLAIYLIVIAAAFLTSQLWRRVRKANPLASI